MPHVLSLGCAPQEVLAEAHIPTAPPSAPRSAADAEIRSVASQALNRMSDTPPPTVSLRAAEKEEKPAAAEDEIDFSEYADVDFTNDGRKFSDLLWLVDADFSKIPEALQQKLVDVNGSITYLSFDTVISLENLETLVLLFPNIVEIEFDSIEISDKYFETVAQLPFLSTIRFEKCGFSFSNRIPNFQKLAFLSTVSFEECSDIDDEIILHLGKLKELHALILSNCRDSIVQATSLAQLKHLRLLDLSGGLWVTDEFLKNIACELKQLETVGLNDCNMVTDEGVRFLAMLESLDDLELKNVTKLTSKALFFLRPVAIESSHLPHNTGYMVRHMQRLSRLDISGCPQIEAEKIAELKAYAPQIEIIQ